MFPLPDASGPASLFPPPVDHDTDRGFSPRCPRCLIPLEPRRHTEPTWGCRECGLVRIC